MSFAAGSIIRPLFKTALRSSRTTCISRFNYSKNRLARHFVTTALKMAENDKVITAYPNHAPGNQEQNLPGLDAKMDPLASHTQLEKWDENGKPYLVEYEGQDRLKGKAAIVTGGDSGIGRAAALMFAREGANVSIVYLPAEQKDADDMVEMAKKNPTGSKELHLIPADLMDEAAVKGVVESHLKRWGRLDIVVNNASKQIMCKDWAEVDLANSESIVRSNLLGMFALTKYSIPHLGRGSCIINSSSVTARKGSLGMVDYSSTKGAIDTFTRSMAMQLKSKGIRVNAVAPGPVITPLQPASRSGDSMEGWAVGEPSLMWQRPSQPAEQGPAYVFLADAGQSNQITGCVLPVNSGSYFTS